MTVDPKPTRIEVKPARKQGHYLLISGSSDSVVIHSRYHPIQEARQWAEEFVGSGVSDRVLLVGGGLGYLPESLRKRSVQCEVIECLPDFEVPTELPICAERNRDAFLRVSPRDNLIDYMGTLPAGVLNNAKILLHPGYEHILPEPESFVDSLHVIARGQLRNIQSRWKLLDSKLDNTKNSLPYLEKSYSVQSLFGCYQDKPGLMIAAGPSLRDSLEWLRDVQNRVLILCVDSAYATLHRAEISVDYVLTMDPQPENTIHIEATNADGALVASIAAHTDYFQWASDIPTYLFYQATDDHGSSPTFPVVKWLKEESSGIGSLRSGGSVATTGIDLLNRMGCDPIGIVGVDHAFTNGRAMTAGSNRDRRFISRLNRFQSLAGQHISWIIQLRDAKGKQLKTVRSREGRSVLTMDEYEVQNQWFEHAVHVIQRECLDLRADGLPMKGWTIIDDPRLYFDRHYPIPWTIPYPKGEPFLERVNRKNIRARSEEILRDFPDQSEPSNLNLETVLGQTDSEIGIFLEPLINYRKIHDSNEFSPDDQDYVQSLRSFLRTLAEWSK